MNTYQIPVDHVDALPDRFDERDFPFQPRVWMARTSVPNDDAKKVPIQEQTRGACTGYAAAGLVNLMLYLRTGQVTEVSPAMLFHLARLYDEWEGEEYSGSSCRGVLKGWHHHGVCEKSLWPDSQSRETPDAAWRESAARHPMGAYYRVDRRSITDLRLAICEAGAVLVSARIHEGWRRRLADRRLQAIERSEDVLGLHAFLLVGYDERGFHVMNSWGGGVWGCKGFAILTYEDWLDHGYDAWVVSLGSPADGCETPPVVTRHGLLERPSETEPGDVAVVADAWPKLRARGQSVVLGKDGKVSQRWIAFDDGRAEILHGLRALGSGRTKPTPLLIYFPGGLESEERTIARIRRLGPLVEPVESFFVLWRTGILDRLVEALESSRFRDWKERELATRPESRDRLVETLARRVLRPFWTEVRTDARHGRRYGGGLSILAQELRKISEEEPSAPIHLAAHSAGVIPLAHLLKLLGPRGSRKVVSIATCTLLAPLCSVRFAHKFFSGAFKKGVVGKLFCECLRHEVELTDSIGSFYGASLPSLVSRVLERDCDTPLLCLEQVWDPPPSGVLWHPSHRSATQDWRALHATEGVQVEFLGPEYVGTDGRSPVSPGHLAFERDLCVFRRLAQRCLAS